MFVRRVVVILVGLGLVLGTAACAAPEAPPEPEEEAPAPEEEPGPAPPEEEEEEQAAQPSGETVTWTMNWGYAPALSADGAAGKPDGRFESTLLQKSDGRFKLNVRERMVPRDQELDFLADNKAQLGDMSITYVSGTYPLLDFGALPFRFNSIFQYEACMQDQGMIDIFDSVMRDADLEYLSSLPSGAMKFIWAKKPLTSVDDFQGLKVRTTGAIATKAFELLGASPTSIPGPEIGDAMYRGVVDAVVTTLDYGIEQGLPEMSSHISVWNVMPVISGAWCANAEAYDALPADLREILEETAVEVSRQQYYAAEPEFRAFRTWTESTGIELVYPNEEEVLKAREMTSETVQDWLDNAGPHGPDVLDISEDYIPPNVPGWVTKWGK